MKSYFLYAKQERYSGQDWADVIPQVLSPDGDGTMPLVIKSNDDSVCTSIYSLQYLTIESESNNHEIYWQSLPHTALSQTTVPKTISASTDNGATWTEYTSASGGNGTLIATLNTGDKVLLKGLNSAYGEWSAYYNRFTTNSRSSNIKRCKVYGNIMSLLYGDNFVGQTAITEGSTFFYLFGGLNYSLTSAENLILPATTLTSHCYRWMFSNCYYLTAVPELPATTLAEYCYSMMFGGCNSLATAPELPATTLASHCYETMFFNCSGLTTAPELPATTLAENCYHQMFAYCSSLTTAPLLPATTLANHCYYAMFQYCTNLIDLPPLPATTLADSCYESMFEYCTNLVSAPPLYATTLVWLCYNYMFRGCANLGYIKCLAVNNPGQSCTYKWVEGVDGVATTGTFVKSSSASWWTTGDSGIPSGWTVQNNE